jgi:hypothetical protein
VFIQYNEMSSGCVFLTGTLTPAQPERVTKSASRNAGQRLAHAE